MKLNSKYYFLLSSVFHFFHRAAARSLQGLRGVVAVIVIPPLIFPCIRLEGHSDDTPVNSLDEFSIISRVPPPLFHVTGSGSIFTREVIADCAAYELSLIFD